MIKDISSVMIWTFSTWTDVQGLWVFIFSDFRIFTLAPIFWPWSIQKYNKNKEEIWSIFLEINGTKYGKKHSVKLLTDLWWEKRDPHSSVSERAPLFSALRMICACISCSTSILQKILSKMTFLRKRLL